MRPPNPSGGRFNRHMIAPWTPIFGRRRSYQSWQQQVHHGNASYSRRLFSHSACVVTALPRRRLITPSLGKIRCSDDVIETFHRLTVFFIHVPSILVLSRKIALCGDFLWFTKWYDMEADGSCGYAYYYYYLGVKTRQNVKQRLQRLLIRCSLCWGRRPHSSAAELWTGVETEDCFSGVLGDDCGASANLLD